MKGPILLVEDNLVDGDLTLRAFQRSQISASVEVVRDGEELFEQMALWEAEGKLIPRLILLDLNLPRVGGLEVLRQLKSHPRFRIIPVVVLTTSLVRKDVQAAYDCGANSYIVKPMNFEKFVEVVLQIQLYWDQLNEPPQ